MTDRGNGGLIRLHLVHHTSARPLYPILHRLEKKGYLRSTERRLGRTARRMYRITPSGRCALEGAKQKVYELFGEMFLRR
ncbi:MAG: PadR family transcriptional regulator [Steroidobacteraceae bacterium]